MMGEVVCWIAEQKKRSLVFEVTKHYRRLLHQLADTVGRGTCEHLFDAMEQKGLCVRALIEALFELVAEARKAI